MGSKVDKAGEDNVLRYFPEQRGVDSSAIALPILLAPLVVAMITGLVGLPELSLPLAAVTFVALWLYRRRQKSRPAAVLEVVRSRLLVTDADAEVLLDVPLEDLLNVTLDTKTIQRVQENAGSSIPDLRFINSVVGPSLDESRIELETVDGAVLLAKDYTSNIDATDWFGKIRKFLRKHGWVPASER